MKIIKGQREVNYFGIPLFLPEDFIFITTDMDGTVYSWLSEPFLSNNGEWVGGDVENHYIELAIVNLNGRIWSNTLVEIAK